MPGTPDVVGAGMPGTLDAVGATMPGPPVVVCGCCGVISRSFLKFWRQQQHALLVVQPILVSFRECVHGCRAQARLVVAGGAVSRPAKCTDVCVVCVVMHNQFNRSAVVVVALPWGLLPAVPASPISATRIGGCSHYSKGQTTCGQWLRAQCRADMLSLDAGKLS